MKSCLLLARFVEKMKGQRKQSLIARKVETRQDKERKKQGGSSSSIHEQEKLSILPHITVLSDPAIYNEDAIVMWTN